MIQQTHDIQELLNDNPKYRLLCRLKECAEIIFFCYVHKLVFEKIKNDQFNCTIRSLSNTICLNACILFRENKGKTHYTKLLDNTEEELLIKAGLTKNEFDTAITNAKKYRDKFVAHADDHDPKNDNEVIYYPITLPFAKLAHALLTLINGTRVEQDKYGYNYYSNGLGTFEQEIDRISNEFSSSINTHFANQPRI